MVAVGKNAEYRTWDRFCVEMCVLERDNLVFRPMVQEDRHPRRQTFGQIGARCDVLALPSTVSDERRRDQNEGVWPELQPRFGEDVDKNRAADGMADEDSTIVKPVELSHQGGLPGRIARIGFVRHLRITNAVVGTELSLEAQHQLVVTLVCPLSGALNKQDFGRHHEKPLAIVPGR